MTCIVLLSIVPIIAACLIYIVSEAVESKEENSTRQEYILSYGVDKVNYVGFVAERVEYRWDKHMVTYYLDNSYIYVCKGYIVREYNNGTIECYTNGMITAH